MSVVGICHTLYHIYDHQLGFVCVLETMFSSIGQAALGLRFLLILCICLWCAVNNFAGIGSPLPPRGSHHGVNPLASVIRLGNRHLYILGAILLIQDSNYKYSAPPEHVLKNAHAKYSWLDQT